MVGAHELALTFTTGETRMYGLDTCHSCDNPICCNPDHLRFDTRQSNVDDATGRSRHAHGDTNGASKLTEDDVVLIKSRITAGATQKQMAEEFRVAPSTISMIVSGKRWAHLGSPAQPPAIRPRTESQI